MELSTLDSRAYGGALCRKSDKSKCKQCRENIAVCGMPRPRTALLKENGETEEGVWRVLMAALERRKGVENKCHWVPRECRNLSERTGATLSITTCEFGFKFRFSKQLDGSLYTNGNK